MDMTFDLAWKPWIVQIFHDSPALQSLSLEYNSRLNLQRLALKQECRGLDEINSWGKTKKVTIYIPDSYIISRMEDKQIPSRHIIDL
jgi:hypothetical protein